MQKSSNLLAALSQRRDPEALSRLYDSYASVVYQRGLSAGLGCERSEKLVEEVFFSVWKRAGSYDGSVDELEWLLAVASAAVALPTTRVRWPFPKKWSIWPGLT